MRCRVFALTACLVPAIAPAAQLDTNARWNLIFHSSPQTSVNRQFEKEALEIIQSKRPLADFFCLNLFPDRRSTYMAYVLGAMAISNQYYHKVDKFYCIYGNYLGSSVGRDGSTNRMIVVGGIK